MVKDRNVQIGRTGLAVRVCDIEVAEGGMDSAFRPLRTPYCPVVGVHLKAELHALWSLFMGDVTNGMNDPFRVGAFPSHLLNAGYLAENLKVGKKKVEGISLRDRGAAVL